MMKRILRWIGGALLVLLVLVGALFALGSWKAERDMRTVYTVDDPPLPALSPAEIAADGAHLFATRGCADCHGAHGEGTAMFDAGPVIRVTAPNLTALAGRYDADAIGRAIRHGLRHDGTPLVFMPAGDYENLSDRDTALLAGYVLSLPPVDAQPEPLEVRALGRVLHLLGLFPLLPAQAIDHAPRQRHAPEVAPTAQYGFYLAQVCSGCHGTDFAGRTVVAHAPPASDLRPGAALAGWNEADFIHAMRTGKRPDGRALDPFMPWPAIGRMTDTELRALWLYLQTLPPSGT